MKERRKFVPITEEMKEWAAHLDRELCEWPGVTRRQMFGMVVFYRDDKIFAAIPRTKGFDPPNSVSFKLYAEVSGMQQDPRIVSSREKGWIGFELRKAADLHGAMRWFDVAYRSAKKGLR